MYGRFSRIALALAMTACLSAGTQAEESHFAVIGYLPEFRVANAQPARFAPLTDLVYFGLEPPADGRLAEVPIEPSVLRKLHEIRRRSNCRLLLCVGGWNRSEGFLALANDDVARQRFIAALREYCQKNNFDGVDYDWEHPEGAEEMAAYGRLLRDTKAALGNTRLLVTVAQAPWQDLGKQVYQAIDRVHLMSYDHEFPQATFDKSQADVNHLIDVGCPAEKIALGLPFYGRNEKGEARTYAQLVGERIIDPHTDSVDGFAFNGKATITRKVDFAMKRNLAGVMIWELGQDTSHSQTSLLTTIDRHRRSSTSNQGANK